MGVFADETKQRGGRGRRGARRNERRLFPEDIDGDDNDDDDDSAGNADVDDDSYVSAVAVPARGVPSIDIVSGRLAAARRTARWSVPWRGRRDRHVFVCFLVRGRQQTLDQRPLFPARVAEKTGARLVEHHEITDER